MSEIKKIEILGLPLYDRKVEGNSYLCRITIGEYIKLVKLEENPYQREVLGKRHYKKLISDLLDDTIIPAISLVTYNENFEEEKFISGEEKIYILDGLQRTNCILECIKILEEGRSNGKIQTSEEFMEKIINIEVWTGLDLRNLLYKMVVLNTGQQTMKYEHQLDILSGSLEEKLRREDISDYRKSSEKGEEKENKFLLSDIVQAFVSFINRSPVNDKKNAAEFLFERLNMDLNEADEGLELINNEDTYQNIIWFFKEFNPLVDEKYGKEKNPFRRYSVYLISFFAALGHSYSKDKENLAKKKSTMTKKFEIEDDDPLKLAVFEANYNKFKTGIGSKRKKYIFEGFKDFFLRPHYNSDIDWSEVYETHFGN